MSLRVGGRGFARLIRDVTRMIATLICPVTKKRIPSNLVTDDEAGRECLKRALVVDGHIVEFATGGLEAFVEQSGGWRSQGPSTHKSCGVPFTGCLRSADT